MLSIRMVMLFKQGTSPNFMELQKQLADLQSIQLDNGRFLVQVTCSFFLMCCYLQSGIFWGLLPNLILSHRLQLNGRQRRQYMIWNSHWCRSLTHLYTLFKTYLLHYGHQFCFGEMHRWRECIIGLVNQNMNQSARPS